MTIDQQVPTAARAESPEPRPTELDEVIGVPAVDDDGNFDVAAHALGDFEGWPVLAAGCEVSNAGGGLNEDMKVLPQRWEMGDTVLVVMRCDVTKVRFQPIKGGEGFLKRVHVLRATDTAIVTGETADAVDAAIRDFQLLVLRAREDRNAGTPRLLDAEGRDLHNGS